MTLTLSPLHPRARLRQCRACPNEATALLTVAAPGGRPVAVKLCAACERELGAAVDARRGLDETAPMVGA